MFDRPSCEALLCSAQDTRAFAAHTVGFRLYRRDWDCAELTAKDVPAQLYQAARSKHNPLDETQLLGRYFDAGLLKLYLRDKRQAKDEVSRLGRDPLYKAQDIEITDFTISPPETMGREARVTVRFKNFGKSARIVYVLTQMGDGWKISDIRYEDCSSLKKILEGKL